MQGTDNAPSLGRAARSPYPLPQAGVSINRQENIRPKDYTAIRRIYYQGVDLPPLPPPRLQSTESTPRQVTSQTLHRQSPTQYPTFAAPPVGVYFPGVGLPSPDFAVMTSSVQNKHQPPTNACPAEGGTLAIHNPLQPRAQEERQFYQGVALPRKRLENVNPAASTPSDLQQPPATVARASVMRVPLGFPLASLPSNVHDGRAEEGMITTQAGNPSADSRQPNAAGMKLLTPAEYAALYPEMIRRATEQGVQGSGAAQYAIPIRPPMPPPLVPQAGVSVHAAPGANRDPGQGQQTTCIDEPPAEVGARRGRGSRARGNTRATRARGRASARAGRGRGRGRGSIQAASAAAQNTQPTTHTEQDDYEMGTAINDPASDSHTHDRQQESGIARALAVVTLPVNQPHNTQAQFSTTQAGGPSNLARPHIPLPPHVQRTLHPADQQHRASSILSTDPTTTQTPWPRPPCPPQLQPCQPQNQPSGRDLNPANQDGRKLPPLDASRKHAHAVLLPPIAPILRDTICAPHRRSSYLSHNHPGQLQVEPAHADSQCTPAVLAGFTAINSHAGSTVPPGEVQGKRDISGAVEVHVDEAETEMEVEVELGDVGGERSNMAWVEAVKRSWGPLSPAK